MSEIKILFKKVLDELLEHTNDDEWNEFIKNHVCGVCQKIAYDIDHCNYCDKIICEKCEEDKNKFYSSQSFLSCIECLKK